MGKADFRSVIDEIAAEADNLITVLRQHNGGTVDLSQPARTKRGSRGGLSGSGEGRTWTPRQLRLDNGQMCFVAIDPEEKSILALPQFRWRLRNSRILRVASVAASSLYSSQ